MRRPLVAAASRRSLVAAKDLPLLLAGGGLKLGEHQTYPSKKRKRIPACNLLLSILQNFGIEVVRFGTSTGTPKGLERSQT